MTDKSRTIQELLRENASLKQKIQKMEQVASSHTNHAEILNTREEENWRVVAAPNEELFVEDQIKYQELAESISDVFFAMDKNLKYTYWNKASKELTGISAETALGKTLMDLFPDNKALQQVKEMYLRVMETKKPEHMTVNYPGDDQITHEISTYPSREGVSVFVKDITGSIQAEMLLRESEEKFRTIIDSNPTSMAIVNMTQQCPVR